MSDLIVEAQLLPDGVLPSNLQAQLDVFLSRTEGEEKEWLEALIAGTPFSAPSLPSLVLLEMLDPIVNAYKAQTVLFALAYEMPEGTSLRHALAFMIIALAHYQGARFTVTDLLARGDLDQKGDPIFIPSFRRAYVKLVEQELIKTTQRDRHNDLSLTPKGQDLIGRVNRRIGGVLMPYSEDEIDRLRTASEDHEEEE